MLKSCVATHNCPEVQQEDLIHGHRQLTSEFLGYKLMKEIACDATVKVKYLMETLERKYGYPLKYGKTWKAKANAIRILYGDYEEAYNRLPRLLVEIFHRKC